MEISEYKQLFLNEAQEILSSASNVLIKLEQEPDDTDLLNELFRQSHTLKSMAQSMQYKSIARLTHAMEAALALLRSGGLKADRETVDLLFKALDTLSVLVAEVKTGRSGNVKIGPLVERFEALASADPKAETKQRVKMKPASETDDAGSGRTREQAAQKILSSVSATELQAVRVPLAQLDSLVDIAGELAINKTRLNQITQTIENGSLEEVVAELSRLTAQLQDQMMQVRLVPLEYIFTPYPRLVRDMATDQKKQVDLVMVGSHIGMDRAIQAEINEPLLHLLKNAVTHGIEDVQTRKKLKKPNRAKIKLSARREGDFIIIELADDGRGIDIDEVKRIALAKGIVTTEELSILSPVEIGMLVTRPEYSGASKVTEAAGRGVGLNAVRVKVESFGGTLGINTRLNQGTTFIIKLPLTMAIVQVILVGIARETYGIPLSYISETIKILPRVIKTVEHREMISYRDTVLPLVRLKSRLGFLPDRPAGPGQEADNSRSIPVVVVEAGANKVGLIVDSLLGQQEAVIKPLTGVLKEVKGVSGATILGTGKVSFIVDVLSII